MPALVTACHFSCKHCSVGRNTARMKKTVKYNNSAFQTKTTAEYKIPFNISFVAWSIADKQAQTQSAGLIAFSMLHNGF